MQVTWRWKHQFSSVQLLSHIRFFATSWTAACQASLSITNSQSFHSVQSLSCVQLYATPRTAASQPPCSSPTTRVYSNSRSSSRWYHPTILSCHPLLLLPSIFPRVFSNESVLRIRWPKDWSFSFSIGLSNEDSGLISFRMDWLDLLAGQGTLKSLLLYHSSKAPILQCSAFFTVQLSHPYMTTGKTIAFTGWILLVK